MQVAFTTTENMGLSIHYRGTLTDKRAIYQLIEELEDIAKAMQWPYTVLDEDWGQRPTASLDHNTPGVVNITGKLALKGIQFKPHPDCQSAPFFFNASCVLTSPVQVALSAEEGYAVKNRWQSVKTQFAGPDTHAVLVRLLRYLQTKYLHDLEVSDEGGYWESGDFDALKEKMDFLDKAIDKVGQALNRIDMDVEDEEDVVAKIEQILRDLKKGEE